MCVGGWSNVPRDRGPHQRGKSDADDTQRARARERCALRKREARRLRAFAKRLFLSEERSPEKRAATGREGGGREGGGGTASENGVNREYRDRVASRPAEWLSRHYAYAPVALSAR
jgi:hypothetical protein